jgi:hypothetical protein
MPLFADYTKKIFVFTSYKVAYSTLLFEGGKNLNYLNHEVDWIIYKHLLRHFKFLRIQLLRNPYDRIFSLFKDKFRIVPARISNQDFKWQPIHHIIFPFIGVGDGMTNEQIAEKILNMSIDDFIDFLPRIYLSEGHLIPQKLTSAFRIKNGFYYPLRINKYLKIEEDKEEIGELLNLNFFTARRNVTNSSIDKFELSEKSIRTINRLYEGDFKLGDYEIRKF